MSSRYKNIARVVKTHGSKGEVVVASLPGLPFVVEEGMRVALTPPALDRDRFVSVESVAPTLDGGRVSFSCSHDLHGAEKLVGCYVLARTEDIDLDPLDVAFDDLLGREVFDDRYGSLGSIVEVMQTPANDVWVVDGSCHGEVLIPVIDHVVTEVPDDGPISVRIMDGLIDS